jgi:hypothetical protein
MKRWYGPNIPCPDCENLVKPEYYTGFWRIPEHNFADSLEPCGAYGEKVIAP